MGSEGRHNIEKKEKSKPTNIEIYTGDLDKKIYALSEKLNFLKEKKHYFYLPEIQEGTGMNVKVENKNYLIFSSYSYLGLLGHPKINAAAIEAIDKYGTGTHGVRILAGTLKLHNELEKTIADFKQRESAIVFSSGYVTNLTAISTLLSRNSVVYCDKLDHASIVDGCLLSQAKFLRFNHNNVEELKTLLEKTKDAKEKLVVVDAVFSMDGDITPLDQIIDISHKYNAWVMVDEAHSLGVLGKSGVGIEDHFNCVGKVDILMGTLSKTIPAVGGYITGKKEIIDYLKHVSRAFVFSAALPPPAVAAAKASFDVIKEETWRWERMWDNTNRFHNGLKKLGYSILNSTTPITPIITYTEEKTLEATRFLWDRGIFVSPILHPAVPPQTNRLRATVTAGHKPEEINFSLEVFAEAMRKFKFSTK